MTEQQPEAVTRQQIRRLEISAAAADALIREILEALCRRDGLPLESSVVPGESARNYDLAIRLGIGHVFGCELEAAAESSRAESPAPAPAEGGAAIVDAAGRDSGPVPDRWVTAFLAALNEQAGRDRAVTWTMPGTEEARVLLAVAAQWLEQENAVSWGTDCTSCARLLDRSYADHARAEGAEAKLAEVRGICRDIAAQQPSVPAPVAAILAIIGTEEAGHA